MKNMNKILAMTIIFALMGAVSATAPTNVVVDFDETSFDTNLRPGDSGILNLVVKNTGGYRAEDVEIWVPGTSLITINKRYTIGRMEASASKTIPVVVRISDQSKTGLSSIAIKVVYDGFDSEGVRENNKETTWEYPVRLYGEPLFSLTPERTHYPKDNVQSFMIAGLARDEVKNLQATFSSSCSTVIGSSKQFVGNVQKNEKFNLVYDIKPTEVGACTINVALAYKDQSGSSATDNISLGIDIEEAGVDLTIEGVKYETTGPGESTKLSITLKNVGKVDSEDTTMTISLSEPFAPEDTPEKYIGKIAVGETKLVEFNVAVGWEAETKTYSIPATIKYKESGSSKTLAKNIGLDVSGRVILEIINVDAVSGQVRVEVANIGTRTADAVKATLTTSLAGAGNATMRSTERLTPDQMAQRRETRNNTQGAMGGANVQSFISYKSDIKPNKQTTFTFDTTVSGSANVQIEYTGVGNERVIYSERINVGTGSAAARASRTGTVSTGTDYTTYLAYGLALVLAYFLFKKLRTCKKK